MLTDVSTTWAEAIIRGWLPLMMASSDDGFRSGCRNVSQHQQQSFSGIHYKPGRSLKPQQKPYDYLLITYRKKFNGRSVTGSRGSCLLCWMFGNSLENLGKSTGECKNKHSDKFPKFSKIFGSLRKSSEPSKIFGKIGKCRKVLKKTLQHFLNFNEIFGNHRKSSEIFGKFRKFVAKCLK